MLTTGSEDQKRLYARTLRGETSAAISLHLQLAPGNQQALSLALTTLLRRKGRVLDAMIEQYGALNGSHEPQDMAVRKQLSDARRQLSTLINKATTSDFAQYQSAVASLETRIDGLEAAASSGKSVFHSQAITVERVRQAIPTDAVLVEFVSYVPTFPHVDKPPSEPLEGPHYAAYVLQHEGTPAWVELGKTAPIDIDVAHFRSALRNPQRIDVKQLARSLDEKLMRPVRKLLGTKRRVFISPDGTLNLIPFGALVDEENHFLVENYSISYLTSGRDLLRLQVSSKSLRGPLLMADPLFDVSDSGAIAKEPSINLSRSRDLAGTKFDRLPGTAQEANALSLLLHGATVLTGPLATEAILKHVSGPSILHVATHGFFLADEPEEGTMLPGLGDEINSKTAQWQGFRYENPLLRSGLALAGANQLEGGNGEDGILTALEVSGLSLWGTELVVLSACETALGEIQNGEGVFGLRRALMLAGAESQVMSLWKVNDEVTRDLMLAYYRGLISKQGRSEALRQVQLRMLKGKTTNHPYFWAAFIESGDWRKLDAKATVSRN